MAKAGSSSIQHWLESSPPEDGTGTRFTRAVARATDSVNNYVEFEVHGTGSVNSGWVVARYLNAASGDRKAIASDLCTALARCVEQHHHIVVTSENFAHFFWTLDDVILSALDRLARDVRIRVAYYVRPQHTSLEASWRQWGYRLGVEPSEFITKRSDRLRYSDTITGVMQLAPHVLFEVRPFRTDLLDLGSVVHDFASRFLGVRDVADDPTHMWVNRGLPLEIANILRTAPPGLFWADAHDNRWLGRLKKLLADVDLPESEETALSRHILHRYAFDEFEPGNRKLIEQLTWPTNSFIPEPDADTSDLTSDTTLKALDQLWSPRSSEAERALLFRMMAEAVPLTES